MPNVPVTHDVDVQLALLSRAWSTSKGEVVNRLLRHFRAEGAPDSVEPAAEGEPIHVIYEGTRVSAAYDKETQAVTVLDGPLASQKFKSPSGAASAVVAKMNPSVMPNRNGWGFWTVDASGELLQSIRR